MWHLACCLHLVLVCSLHATTDLEKRQRFLFSGLQGDPNVLPLFSVEVSKPECAMLCVQLAACQSFSFQAGMSGCRLYPRRIMALDVDGSSQAAHFSRIWASCPTWKDYVTVPGTNKCILVSNAPLTWTKAADTCGKDGGHLLIIENDDVMQKLLDFLPQGRYHVGFNDLISEDKLLWLDRTAVNGSLFHKGEPSDLTSSTDEDCGVLVTIPDSQGLHDAVCWNLKQFLCSVPVEM